MKLFCRGGFHANSEMYEELCPCMLSRQDKGAAFLIGETMSDYVVRRLTPVECERLQGFPDGWTDIKKKVRKRKEGGWEAVEVDETPDTPRYKAMGNSMAVPVMRWIGERIAMADGIAALANVVPHMATEVSISELISTSNGQEGKDER